MSDGVWGLGERVREVRREVCGDRGMGAFARLLGVRATTYGYYEKSREPTLEVLVRLAAVSGVDLNWLLTGRGAKYGRPEASGPGGEAERAVRELVVRRPGTAKVLMEVVHALRGAWGLEPLAEVERETREWGVEDLIAVLGWTAGGVEGFWEGRGRGSGVGGQGSESGGESRPAVEGVSRSGGRDTTGEGSGARGEGYFDGRIGELLEHGRRYRVRRVEMWGEKELYPADGRTWLVELAAPMVEGTVAVWEWSRLKDRYPDVVAWRMVGRAMSPLLEEGDLVAVTRWVEPVPGWACVARLWGRPGVVCRVYEREGGKIVLRPMEKRCREIRVESGEVMWIARVVGGGRVGN